MKYNKLIHICIVLQIVSVQMVSDAIFAAPLEIEQLLGPLRKRPITKKVITKKKQNKTPSKHAIKNDTPSPVDNIELLENKVRDDPKDYESWLALGNNYYSSGRINDSIYAFHWASILKPQNSELYYFQGVLHQQLSDKTKAIECFEKALSIDPNDHSSEFNIGLIYSEEASGHEKAVKIWNELLSKMPDGPEREFVKEKISNISIDSEQN